ncbi:MAG TPA: hypothetical protein VFV64_05360 [Permianibacter sp.]|nr:hypothetical protein [Permianibacter sp.]
MRLVLLISVLAMAACSHHNASTLTPKNIVQADAEAVPEYPHYQYQSHCGKPCQPVTVRWQLSGAYTVQHGGEPVITGKMESAQVQRLASLYAELQTLTLGMPKDLTRSSICERFATDHAVKIFSTPATVDGWTFKDNHGCKGFGNVEKLRALEAMVEATLPSAIRRDQSR